MKPLGIHPSVAVIQYRTRQTRAVGCIAKACGCPKYSTGSHDCVWMRTAQETGGCLCVCHYYPENADLRSQALRDLRGAGF